MTTALPIPSGTSDRQLLVYRTAALDRVSAELEALRSCLDDIIRTERPSERDLIELQPQTRAQVETLSDRTMKLLTWQWGPDD